MSFSVCASVAVTAQPRAAQKCAVATPVLASPTTRTRLPRSSNGFGIRAFFDLALLAVSVVKAQPAVAVARAPRESELQFFPGPGQSFPNYLFLCLSATQRKHPRRAKESALA